MRLLSLDRARAEALATLRRFPLVIACAVTAAVAAIVSTSGSADGSAPSTRLLAVSLLGLSTLTAATLAGEQFGRRGIWLAGGVLALAAVYAAWPGFVGPVPEMRYAQLVLVAHLAVACVPAWRINANGFWQYNRTLLLRILIAGVFSAALFAGLAVALLAIDNLLGIEIDDDTYGRLWIVVAFVFNTWFFLGGLPARLDHCEEETGYPRGLKVFAQFILAPIVAVYLLILTVYLGKIILTAEWPSGWIGWLVSSVAAAGTLSLLLLYPASRESENTWVAHYARWFHAAMLPSIAMLLLAIFTRIGQYGITERRYIVVVLALWFAAIAVYQIATRRETLRAIPVSLAVIALLTMVGPWSAYSVARRSQINRLAAMLTDNGILAEGVVRTATGPVSAEDAREISAIFRYLLSTHDTTGWSRWFGDRLAGIDTVEAGRRRTAWAGERRANVIVSSLGITYAPRYGGTSTYQNVRVERVALPVGRYDYVVALDLGRVQTFELDGEQWEVNVAAPRERITLRRSDSSTIALDLSPLLRELRDGIATGRWDGARVPSAALRLDAERDGVAVRAQLREVSWRESDRGPETGSFSGWLFIRMAPR